MTDESKIISLSDRARLRKGPRERNAGAAARGKSSAAGEAKPAGHAALQPAGSAPLATGPQPPVATTPVPAQLVWLYCPTCQTLEYTELLVPNGRVHQPCGTRVEETVVDVDARAEYSLAELNLRQLERLAELVDGQRARFREYQQRLELAAHQPLSSYPLTEDTVRLMPVAEVDPLGLLISPFLRQPVQRFRPEPGAAKAPPESAASQAPADSAVPPAVDSGVPPAVDSGAPPPDSGKPAP
jgi:hypothetical protein